MKRSVLAILTLPALLLLAGCSEQKSADQKPPGAMPPEVAAEFEKRMKQEGVDPSGPKPTKAGAAGPSAKTAPGGPSSMPAAPTTR